MISASFIFTEKLLSDEFHQLDGLIAKAAEATEGYIGKESWVAADGSGKRNSVYYWEHEAALSVFARHPAHLEAKRRYQEWYGGFHVVIAELRKSYGDGAFDHVTPNRRARA